MNVSNMNINKRKVLIGIAIIILIWAANLVYYRTQQLSEPLVLKSYNELYLAEISAFDIYYLMNKGDKRHLMEVRLPEGFSLQINGESSESTYTHHTLKRASIVVHKDYIKGLLDDGDYSATELELRFSNGEIVKTEIGELIIHQVQDQADRPLQFMSGGGSSNNTGFTLFSVEKPVVLHSLNYQWQEELKDFLQVYVDTSQEPLAEIADLQRSEERESRFENREKLTEGLHSVAGKKLTNDLFPITLEAGDYIKINHIFDNDKQDNIDMNYYFINLKLVGETIDHREFEMITRVDYRPYFTNSDIRQIIREKRGK